MWIELLACWKEGQDDMRKAMWRRMQSDDHDLASALEDIPWMSDLPEGDKLTPVVQQAQDGCRLWEEGEWAQAVSQWKPLNLRVGSKKNWGEERLPVVKAYLKAIREAAKALESNGAVTEFGLADERAAHALQLWRGLWVLLDDVYSRLKDEQQALDFDDLELLTARLLRDKGGTDQRLQGYLAGIRHVLVDEYQDTNPTQQAIVYALAPLDKPGMLFLVGDPKQSIYRFRQAQVSIFNRTAGDLLRVTGHGPEPLSCSFRTHSAMVETVNHLFDRLLQPLDGDTYADYEAPPGPLTAIRESASVFAPVEITLLARKTSGKQHDNRRRGSHMGGGHTGGARIGIGIHRIPSVGQTARTDEAV